MEKHFLPVEQAADYLGVSESFLNSRRVTGGGPIFIKLGRKVVYARSDLNSWVQARRVSSTSTQLEAA